MKRADVECILDARSLLVRKCEMLRDPTVKSGRVAVQVAIWFWPKCTLQWQINYYVYTKNCKYSNVKRPKIEKDLKLACCSLKVSWKTSAANHLFRIFELAVSLPDFLGL